MPSKNKRSYHGSEGNAYHIDTEIPEGIMDTLTTLKTMQLMNISLHPHATIIMAANPSPANTDIFLRNYTDVVTGVRDHICTYMSIKTQIRPEALPDVQSLRPIIITFEASDQVSSGDGMDPAGMEWLEIYSGLFKSLDEIFAKLR